MEVRQQEKLAAAHHPPPSTQTKVLRPKRIKILGPAAPETVKDTDIFPSVLDVSSDSGDEYDPDREDKAPGGELEDDISDEENVLDDSSEDEGSKAGKKKRKNKSGHGELRKAVQSAQGKHVWGDVITKRKASDSQEESPAHTARMHPSKKAKKWSSGLHDNWLERIQPQGGLEGLEDIQVPCDEPEIAGTHSRSLSPSTGMSFSSSSRPQTSPPDSDDDREGGIADDAGEKGEREHMSGKVLQGYYYGGGSKPAKTGVHPLARIVPTSSVPTFIKPSTSSHVAQTRRKKGDIRLSDLPTHVQNRFTHEFTPRLYELFGALIAWEQPKEVDLQKLWGKVFPDERSLDSQTREGVIVLKLIDDRLSQWRKRFGERALEALEEVTFNDLPKNDTPHREWWCRWALSGSDDSCQPFYYSTYEEPDSADEGSRLKVKGIFQSPLIAAVLGTHIAYLSAIGEDVRSVKKPVGALVHSIQAAKRAISWWETGDMVKPKKPLNEYSKVNWGDHVETREGRTFRINSTSSLVSLVSQLKEKQWHKILVAAQASGKHKKKATPAVSEPPVVTLVELRDDDSDIMDEN